MPDRQGGENQKPFVGRSLVFPRAGHRHIGVAATPVGGRTFLKAMDSLGRDEETQVLPGADGVPRLGAVRVRVFKKKVG
jgi:hypothetical protein